MTTSPNISNVQPAGLSAPTAAANGVPGEAVLRSVPAALAGATGASPQPLLSTPSPESAEALYFLLDSARPTSPQVLPILNLTPPGFEPPLGFTVPASATAADPRGIPGRTAVPGQHLGSTTPKTPGIELGAQPLAPRVSPASAYGAPSEESLRGTPTLAASTVGVSPRPVIAALGGNGSSPYFLGEAGSYVRPGPVPAVEAPAFSPVLLPIETP